MHNEDSPAADVGTLTSTQITGLGWPPGPCGPVGSCPAASPTPDFEDLDLLLGYGDDTFTVESHPRRHHARSTPAPATTPFGVRTIDGPHAGRRATAGNDTFRVGSTAGTGLGPRPAPALLVDRRRRSAPTRALDDSADTTADLGWLTQTHA